jgi:hypothetical protein
MDIAAPDEFSDLAFDPDPARIAQPVTGKGPCDGTG